MIKRIILLGLFFTIIVLRIVNINVYDGVKYKELLTKKTSNYVYGESAPRGRILDRSGKVLVDNIGIKTVIYHKINNTSIKKELDIAKRLSNIIDISINYDCLKKYWLIINDNGKSLITREEYDLYAKRKISNKELQKIKYERITEDMLNELSIEDKKIATIYYLMNKGYSYDRKVIVKGIDDLVYSKLVDSNIEGITTEITWERTYNYGDVLKDIFGRVGEIPEEEKNVYLKNGYELNDIVGLSYLEKQYDNYLRGKKDLYKVNSDKTLELIETGEKGKDLILSIDIDVQLELEKLIKDNIIKAKKRKYTDYFTEMYSIVGNPMTGEILALSGQKNIKDNEFKNVNTNLINTSYTVGSIVKMATVSTGYKNGVIDIGTSVKDSCIKLYQVPIKCSYKNLGTVNDLTAISKSSNYYQFNIAIGLTKEKYKYNMKLRTSKETFDKFRDTFKEYGLGSLTNIDLPNEKIGIIGSLTNSDLLLNLSIGQYDTYTPVELFQYVNTIASNGEKRKPQLMSKIDNTYTNSYDLVSKVPLENKYLNRLKEAMHLAITSGTARSYINKKYNPAGKTGTSETFIDTNNDGIMDTKTTSIGFVGFAPYDEPKYSVIVLAPNLYLSKDFAYSKVYITRYISSGIMNFLFQKQ